MCKTTSQFSTGQLYGVLGLFALLVFSVYSPTLSADFVNFDDPLYVTGNVMVKDGLGTAGLARIFTESHAYNWHPVTWLSHMLDVEIFGLRPLGHHLTSLLFHLVNGLLLFALLRKLTGTTWRSLCVAALFALHPLHVESVAWVSERKDVLSTFFAFLTVWAYHDQVRTGKPADYFKVLLFFTLGLMSKPMLVTLPFVLLLLDYWPLQRQLPTRRLLAEKIPLFVLSALSSGVTYLVQKNQGALDFPASTAQCAGNALITYLRYLQKTVWPSGLSPFYPFDPSIISIATGVGAGIVLLSATFLVLRLRTRHPYLVTGWFWYLGTLVPVIGMVKIGQHAMADRYTYLPLVGVFIMVVWGGGHLAARWALPRRGVAASAVLVLAALSVLSWRQSAYWHDSITLFSRAVEVTDKNWLAHQNLAKAYSDQGNYREALRHAGAAVEIRPGVDQYLTRAWLYSQLGEFEKSNDSCREALALAPENEKGHFLAGKNSVALKQYTAALAEYRLLQRNNSPFATYLLQDLQRAGMSPGVDVHQKL